MKLDNFMGLWARDKLRSDPVPVDFVLSTFSQGLGMENVPPGYFTHASNLTWHDKLVATRQRISGGSITNGTGNIHRMQPFHLSTGNGAFLFHRGRTSAVAVDNTIRRSDTGGIVITAAQMNAVNADPNLLDFVSVQIGNRVYISVMELVSSVWIGAGTALPIQYLNVDTGNVFAAAGAAPAGTLTLVAAAGGVMDAGTYVVAQVDEYETGFLSKPAGHASVVLTAGQRITPVTLIGSALTNVTKRHLVISKPLTKFDGNLNNPGPELFFSGVTINDRNTTLTTTIDVYPSQLVKSADYLLDLLTSLPGAVVLGLYGSKMYFGNISADDFGTLRVSNGIHPEMIDSVDGLVVAGNVKSEPLFNAAEQDGRLYMFTHATTKVTSDNGDVPSSWPVDGVDKARGAAIHGIAKFPDPNPGEIERSLLISNESGLWLFNAGFGAELSYPVKAAWEYLAGGTKFIQIAFDQIRKELLATFSYPSDPTTNIRGDSMFCSFKDGIMSPESARWSAWNKASTLGFGIYSAVTIVNTATGTNLIYIATTTTVAGSPLGQLNLIDLYNTTFGYDNNGGTLYPIDSYLIVPVPLPEVKAEVYRAIEFKGRIIGANDRTAPNANKLDLGFYQNPFIDVDLYPDQTKQITIGLTGTPRTHSDYTYILPLNFKAPRIFFGIISPGATRTTNAAWTTAWFLVDYIDIKVVPEWAEIPAAHNSPT